MEWLLGVVLVKTAVGSVQLHSSLKNLIPPEVWSNVILLVAVVFSRNSNCFGYSQTGTLSLNAEDGPKASSLGLRIHICHLMWSLIGWAAASKRQKDIGIGRCCLSMSQMNHLATTWSPSPSLLWTSTAEMTLWFRQIRSLGQRNLLIGLLYIRRCGFWKHCKLVHSGFAPWSGTLLVSAARWRFATFSSHEEVWALMAALSTRHCCSIFIVGESWAFAITGVYAASNCADIARVGARGDSCCEPHDHGFAFHHCRHGITHDGRRPDLRCGVAPWCCGSNAGETDKVWSLSKTSMCAISSPPPAQGKHFVGHRLPPLCAIQGPPSRWPSWLLVQESFVISGIGFAAKIYGASTCGNPQGHCVAAAQSSLTIRMRQTKVLNFSSLCLLTGWSL